MNLISRAIRICTQPAEEWKVIEREQTPPARVLFGYLLPLALLGGLAAAAVSFWLASPVENERLGIDPATPFYIVAFGVAVTLGACALTAVAINWTAPTFSGTQDIQQAFKAAAYSWTPVLLLNMLRMVPVLGSLMGLLGLVYASYLLYLGLPVLMKSRQDRAVPYASVTAIAAFGALLLMTMLVGMLFIAGSFFTDDPFRIV